MISENLQPPDWLWTWNGISFGYRHGNSLFTYDGIEVGRFSGLEVYGIDGHYIGELGNLEAGARLVTNSYKKGHHGASFIPTFERSHKRLPDRTALGALYCGHEDFPSPEAARSTVLGGSFPQMRKHAVPS